MNQSLANQYPDIAAELHPTKNVRFFTGLGESNIVYAHEIKPSSTQKAWWFCDEGHEYECTVYYKVHSGVGCLMCRKSIATKHPEIAKEWHPTKNGSLRALDLSPLNNEKVWWSCIAGHEWQARTSDRIRRTVGCPYCNASRKYLAGSYPEIAAELHSTMNDHITAHTLLAKTTQKVFWICTEGHEYSKSVSDKVKFGVGCMMCYKSLYITNPDIADMMKAELNDGLSAKMVTSRSSLKVLWQCPEGHEWERTVSGVVNAGKDCCPVCRIKGINDLESVRPDLVLKWHPIKNGKLKPHEVATHSMQNVWWTDNKCGHQYSATVKSMVEGTATCSVCKSFAYLHPEIAKEWHPVKNGLAFPQDYKPGNKFKAWWLGEECGHEWLARIDDRVYKNSQCPVCNNKKVLVGYNDLASQNSKLAAEWHPTRNIDMSSEELTNGSLKVVWWLGKCGHEWEASPALRTSQDTGCPECSKIRLNPEEPSVFYFAENTELKTRKIGIANANEEALDKWVSDGWVMHVVILDKDLHNVKKLLRLVSAWITKNLKMDTTRTRKESYGLGGYSNIFSTHGITSETVVNKINSSWNNLNN